MRITAIALQVKNPTRYSLFVDEKYAFSLSADALLDSGLVQGQELSKDELTAYKKASQDDKAYNLTLVYIARRMRSEGELQDYFRRKGYTDDFGRTVLPKLRRLGLVDDVEFARKWVENRRLLKNTSTKKLRLELRQKHIPDEIVRVVLVDDPTDEHDMLQELIAKKRKQTRYQDDQKLIAYLARQGFDYGEIKSAFQRRVDDE
ncbi:MAG: regulatory protein [Patescibacteria group bacterium]|nr:RecX family transcriptional regulator [Candidatus Saccharibacteria bacterium]MDQ5963228.1 regulatory protein [Patescibacteria group bacterium]